METLAKTLGPKGSARPMAAGGHGVVDVPVEGAAEEVPDPEDSDDVLPDGDLSAEDGVEVVEGEDSWLPEAPAPVGL